MSWRVVREGSFSPNRKETRAYLIRDLQMECDCKSLEIMRVKIYMLIPKLVTLGNTVSERENSVIFLKQDPWELLPWLTVWRWKNLYKQWELTAPHCHWKQVSANHPRPRLCNLPGSSNQHNTGLLSSFKKQWLLRVLKLWRVILQWLWKYSFFLLS